jgi:hypothetical protein
MFRQIREALEKRRAQSFLDSSHSWHAACAGVIAICGQVLGEETIHQRDIGASLDRADRLLFQLRNHASEMRGLLSRGDPDLAKKVGLTTNRVFELRNETARFLIRCQGPDPVSGAQFDAAARRLFYDRAMQEIGFSARQMHAAVQAEFLATWGGLESLISRAGIVEKAGLKAL